MVAQLLIHKSRDRMVGRLEGPPWFNHKKLTGGQESPENAGKWRETWETWGFWSIRPPEPLEGRFPQQVRGSQGPMSLFSVSTVFRYQQEVFTFEA